ncbi:hypothetical protein [Tetragenococcus koreensis]|uniref:ABC transporter permease n=1 Tax=Tetragenococcus koreensis TaxID=290335 RepID=A0AAN4RJA6_9ENTE|nr:hypothetical protein [Tetragenococcus koreensis]MCF1626264.1 hypothetical protein [Tetragenococcus koreensis]MCF1630823.1 hypothetical protein [Tetragenococcus koreensis]GEQ48571.1 ABC transporter permease [Tetragenococcus koreensis]GEQ51000.1 ABC transporter permease [Tetragenococcus koreensis]GEQ53579.1 ABC transporter permease [Tetragenococcus koreensis]
MNKILTLLGYRYRNQLGLSKLSDRNSSIKTHAILTIGGYVLVLCLALAYVISLPSQLKFNQELAIFNPYISSLLFWGLGIWALLSGVKPIIIGFDHKQLLVLPLEKRQVQLVNIFSQLLMQMSICTIVIVISQISLFIIQPYPLLNGLIMMAMIIVIPFFSTVITMFLHFAVKFLLRVVQIKSVLIEATLTLVVFLFPLLICYLQQNHFDAKQGIAATSLIRTSLLAPAATSDWLRALGQIVAATMLLTLLCIFIVKNYDRLMLFVETKHSISQKYVLRVTNPLAVLVKREGQRYFSSFSYVVNTILSPLLLLITSVGLILGIFPTTFSIEIPQTSLIIPSSYTYFIVFIVGTCLTTTTSCSFSMEGRTIWISQHLPVSIKKLSLAKGLLNTGLFLPGLFFSIISLALVFNFSGIELLLQALLLMVNVLLVTVLGLFVNLKFPSYDWTNEMIVVKQGAATLITAVCSMGIILVEAVGIVLWGSFSTVILCITGIVTTAILIRKIGKVRYL